jgi:hypothetical protein
MASGWHTGCFCDAVLPAQTASLQRHEMRPLVRRSMWQTRTQRCITVYPSRLIEAIAQCEQSRHCDASAVETSACAPKTERYPSKGRTAAAAITASPDLTCRHDGAQNQPDAGTIASAPVQSPLLSCSGGGRCFIPCSRSRGWAFRVLVSTSALEVAHEVADAADPGLLLRRTGLSLADAREVLSIHSSI